MDSDEEEIELTDEQAYRWLKKGREKLNQVLKVDNWMKNIMNLDVYVKEIKQLSIAHMKRVRHHHHKVVCVDNSDDTVDSDEEDKINAADDFEHPECHRVFCKRNVDYSSLAINQDKTYLSPRDDS